MAVPLHQTNHGAYYHGRSDELLRGPLGDTLRGSVQLILTSPPFPLNHKKSYDNLQGDAYLGWLRSLAPLFADLPNLDVLLTNVEKLRCDMYDNALIPVALANKLVSLADHPSSRIL